MQRCLPYSLLLIALTGCQSEIPEGRFACETLNDCPSNWFCVDSFCYSVPSGACIPTTCETLEAQCGMHPDGCGSVTTQCGQCSGATPYCSAGGKCSSEACVPLSACPSNACGLLSDGCGGILQCAGCELPLSCGGGGIDNECGCTPVTCESQGISCGFIDDGCGAQLDCDAETGGCGGVNSTCVENSCICTPDEGEANDSMTSAEALTLTVDKQGTNADSKAYNLHSSDDVDWFSATLSSGSLSFSGTIHVWLEEIPSPSNYDLSVSSNCSKILPPGNNNLCTIGTPGADNSCESTNSDNAKEEVLFNLSCSNNPVTVYIRVTSAVWRETCAPYRIRLQYTQATDG
ncbi:MAG: hypothetical protein IPJ88_14155 [Myxococcales bacterium]|nr:MAG: hypothetical protein IPJ88_14155 [Myxococcales bacterium]